MKVKKLVISFISGLALSALFAAPVRAAEESDPNKEQFIPVLTYKTGPFAAGGSGFAGGYEDYMTLLNQRDGGINGIKLVSHAR